MEAGSGRLSERLQAAVDIAIAGMGAAVVLVLYPIHLLALAGRATVHLFSRRGRGNARASRSGTIR